MRYGIPLCGLLCAGAAHLQATAQAPEPAVLESYNVSQVDYRVSVLVPAPRANPMPLIRTAIMESARATGLPRELIRAVIRVESNYRPDAVSRAGAEGLMQLLPTTAHALGVEDSFDIRQNVLGGSRYLKRLYKRFGTVELALAAYNAGPGRVRRAGGIPKIAETQRYVRRVLEEMEALRTPVKPT